MQVCILCMHVLLNNSEHFLTNVSSRPPGFSGLGGPEPPAAAAAAAAAGGQTRPVGGARAVPPGRHGLPSAPAAGSPGPARHGAARPAPVPPPAAAGGLGPGRQHRGGGGRSLARCTRDLIHQVRRCSPAAWVMTQGDVIFDSILISWRIIKDRQKMLSCFFLCLLCLPHANCC